jgi:hypothetical protein
MRILAVTVLIFLSAVPAPSTAEDQAQRIRTKVELVQQKAKRWVSQGRNPSEALALVKQASQAFDSGKSDLGENLVDKALLKLDSVSTAKAAPGPVSTLYGNPHSVEIAGYYQDAMEPCISLDGQYLFFNSSNEKKDTTIFCAKRLSTFRFQLLGPIVGIHRERELAPTIDMQNRLYFTETASYGADRKTLYVGQWSPNKIAKVQAVSGDISPQQLGWINMDCAISSDDNTLMISRAKISGGGVPASSYLLMAKRGSGNNFVMAPNSDEILKNIATPSLQYAPAITRDGLELYFTRCSGNEIPSAAMSAQPFMQTMVARRSSVNQPFGPPARLSAIDGFAEAPSLTLDKRELFIHKKVDGLFRIIRLQRLGD